MLNEHIGIVLKDVMDGKGKRLEINVRPVLAAQSCRQANVTRATEKPATTEEEEG